MTRLFLAFALLALPMAASAQDKIFRAGAAASNITPPLGSPIVGGFTEPPATHVHDELFVRALVLDDGSTKLAIVLCDSVGITRVVYDEAKRLIKEETGIPPENVLTAATHTHSGTNARGDRKIIGGVLDEYQRFLAVRIRDAVKRAVNQLEPARIGWGRAENGKHVFNRRWKVKPGSEIGRNPFGGVDSVRMNPPANHPDLIEPAGGVDPLIYFLSVQSTSGRPIALLANYSLHYVGGVKSGDISADYFGVFSRRIAKLLKAEDGYPAFVGILSNGTSGDINNVNFRPGPNPPRYQPYEKMEMVANDIANDVYKVYQTLEYQNWVPLGASQKEIPMGVRVPSAQDVQWAEATLKSPPKYHAQEATYARRVLQMKDLPREIPLLMQTLRIGDVGIAAIPAETFVEIGQEIRRRSPFKHTFTIELANGWYGYLPSAAQHKLGGYETWRGTNYLEVEASIKIADAAEELMRKTAARQ